MNKQAKKTITKTFLENPSIRTPRKLFCVYHIGTFGNWSTVVDEQMKTIKSSGLYDKLDFILVGAHGPDCEALVNKKFENDSKVYIKIAEETDQTYENKTINELFNLANENPDCYILYIHTKGVTLKNQIQEPWRHYMMEKVVVGHELCIDVLNRGYETAGSLVLLKKFGFGFPHYSGNFFWTTSNHAAKLRPIEHFSKRHEAEKWILSILDKNHHVGIGPSWLNFQFAFMSSKTLFKKYFNETKYLYVF